mmetsp:Transcript_67450/g.186948  ORF Transcript_67450/g.186948 Transcript_67450/m.186948 type:complete len:267 (-) Transcript_67450:763-1563(-)
MRRRRVGAATRVLERCQNGAGAPSISRGSKDGLLLLLVQKRDLPPAFLQLLLQVPHALVPLSPLPLWRLRLGRHLRRLRRAGGCWALPLLEALAAARKISSRLLWRGLAGHEGLLQATRRAAMSLDPASSHPERRPRRPSVLVPTSRGTRPWNAAGGSGVWWAEGQVADGVHHEGQRRAVVQDAPPAALDVNGARLPSSAVHASHTVVVHSHKLHKVPPPPNGSESLGGVHVVAGACRGIVGVTEQCRQVQRGQQGPEAIVDAVEG